ncbi:hypothetical protein ACRE98_29655, partial [Klebsiella pneumoniae]
TLLHRAEHIPTSAQAREKEQNHLKGALTACGYPKWTFVKTATRSKKSMKILSHPGHSYPTKVKIKGNWTWLKILEDVSSLIQRTSSVLTDWQGNSAI